MSLFAGTLMDTNNNGNGGDGGFAIGPPLRVSGHDPSPTLPWSSLVTSYGSKFPTVCPRFSYFKEKSWIVRDNNR
jgi:hypothetical protein